jgi:2,3-bisphosphoglycerate-independent phosphoglycerate mutase
MIEYAQAHNNRLHIVMIFSDGGIHAHTTHLHKLLQILPHDIDIQLHIGADGRDVAPQSLPEYLAMFESEIQTGRIHISSLFGRYFGFDRTDNWNRVEKAYNVITQVNRSEAPLSNELFEILQKRYT